MYSYPDFSQQGYQVISELGRNREGGRITWLASDLNQSQQVVLKQFCFAQVGSSWLAYNAHEREIEVLQKLDHPGIPRYLGAFETLDGFCLIQEYKSALTLADQRHFESHEVKQIAVKILEILVYLQNQIPFVIHRDIKPENILVDDQLNVYLIDFGMSRLGSDEISGSSVFKGTPGFMPPEQMRQLTQASDLYGLGVTLICLLTGIKSTAIQELTDNDDPYKINFRHLLPQLNQRFLSWLELMVQPRLSERFSNAQTALEALRSLIVEGKALEGKDLKFGAYPITHSKQSWECVQVVPGISGYGDIALSPNQDILAILGGTVIHLFEVNTGQLIRTITGGHSEFLGRFAFSPNGLTLASVVCHGTFKTCRSIKLWDVLTGKEIFALTDHSDVSRIAFSPNGRILASEGFGETIKLWDVRTGKELRTLILPSDSKGLNFLTFSRDGRILATGDGDSQKTIKLWDVHTGRELRTLIGHSHPVYCIDFSPDGKTLATGGRDWTVKLWDMETGREIRTLDLNNYQCPIFALTFSPDGRTLAVGSLGGAKIITLWDVESGSTIFTKTNLPGDVKFVAFSQNGENLISGCDDGTIKLWKLQTDRRQKIRVREVGNLLSGLSSVASVAFNPDGQTIVSNSSGTKLLQIPTERQQKIIVREIRPSFFGLDNHLGALSPDGETVAIAIIDLGIDYELRSIQTGEKIRVFAPGYDSVVTFATFSPDGQVFASGSRDGTIKVWDVETGRELCALTELSRIIFIAFSPDKRTIASISGDSIKIGNSRSCGKFINLWDIETGSKICTLTGHSECVYSVAFSPDEQTIATGSDDGTVKLWDVETGSEICTLTGHSEWVCSIAFSPDRRTIASGSSNGTIKLWNIETGSEICTLHHFGVVYSIAFSFNGRTLAAADGSGNIKIWQQIKTLEAFSAIDANRKPEIYLRPSVLKFQTTCLSEKLTQTITIENPVPNTMLEGKWEVAPHPQDPPHTPDTHAWISLEPIEFVSNNSIFYVHINTSKLMADKLYERHLLLHTNAYPEVRPLTVRVKTAPLPLEKREISYFPLVEMFLIGLVTALFQFFAFSWFGTLTGFGYVILMGVGSVFGSVRVSSWLLGVSFAVFGLIAVCSVASILGINFTIGNFTSNDILRLLFVYNLGSLMGPSVARAVGVRMSWGRSVENVLNGRLQLLSAGLGASLVIGCLVGFFNPYILLALTATGLPLFTILLYPPLKQRRLIAKYRQPEKRLIKP